MGPPKGGGGKGKSSYGGGGDRRVMNLGYGSNGGACGSDAEAFWLIRINLYTLCSLRKRWFVCEFCKEIRNLSVLNRKSW